METNNFLLDEGGNYFKGNPNYPFSNEVYKAVGCCMEVHKELGKGFLEIVYKDALEYEFQLQGIPYVREKKLEVYYKGIILPRHYTPDFYVFGKIMLEVKAQACIIEEFYKQSINYLAACRQPLGLLVNFGEDSLVFKRVILTKDRPSH